MMSAMPSRQLPPFPRAVAALALAMAGALAPLTCAAQGASRLPSTAAATDGPDWQALPVEQQRILAPIATQWASLDKASREKWLDVAKRYPSLPPQAQQRMQERMTQWARLPAEQRGEARLRYRNIQQLSPQELQRKWAAYQALPAETREELAQQARRKQRPVQLPDAEPGPREPWQSARTARMGEESGAQGKVNLVPNPLHTVPPPRAVSPTVITAGPGATTTLVTEPPSPPLHQHTGLPKITASGDFVDPQTLLPRKGPQGAAMTPVPAPQPAATR